MKKILLIITACLAFAVTGCNDKEENNPFNGTSWVSETDGFYIQFTDLTCRFGYNLSGIDYGSNYVYTHSGQTASMTPLGESAVSHKAVISGTTITVTNLFNDVAVTMTKE